MSRRKSDTADPVQEAPAEKEAAANVSDLAAKTETETVQVPVGAEDQMPEECRVAHKRLRLRKEPNLGAEVTVELRTWRPDGVGVWMKAEADGLEGWVDTRYLTRDEVN